MTTGLLLSSHNTYYAGVENVLRSVIDQGQILNGYNFLHNISRFMILVSTIGFSGMPDILVWPENILDIALWV